MRNTRANIFGLVATGAALLLAGCGYDAPAGSIASESVLHRGNSAEPRSLDPHYVQGGWESNIVGDLLMGLTVDGPDAVSRPGAAESWETSEDGLTWTFHLRDHRWSDGVPVAAEDFVFAWRRILDPATAAPYASLLYIFKNAQAVNSGTMAPEALGVRAGDSSTLILELEAPAPYLTELLSHFTTYPLPRHVVEAQGAAWARPGTYVGNGPFALEAWMPNDHITLAKNPRFYDAEHVAIDGVEYYPTADANAALLRFRASELDTQDGLPVQQIEWLRANMADAVRIEPLLGIEYIAINNERAPLSDIRVREALNLALDRAAVTDQILRLGNVPAYGIVPPGTANYPGSDGMAFKDMPMDERMARAQMLMRAVGYGPENRLEVQFLYSTSAQDRRVPAAIQQMWREIYVDLEIAQADAAATFTRIQEGDYDLGLVNWIADFNDARNFLFLLLSEGNGKNYARYSSPEFDALIAASDRERDPVRRGQLLAEAEAVALDDYPWAPVYYRVTGDLVQPYVKGWVTNVEDVNRTRWLSIERPPEGN